MTDRPQEGRKAPAFSMETTAGKRRLADHIEIKAADLRNGLLSIDLLRVVPEEAKAKRIPINGEQKPALQH